MKLGKISVLEVAQSVVVWRVGRFPSGKYKLDLAPVVAMPAQGRAGSEPPSGPNTDGNFLRFHAFWWE